MVNYLETAAPVEALIARTEAAGGDAIAVKPDVSDVATVCQIFDAAKRGGVDALADTPTS